MTFDTLLADIEFLRTRANAPVVLNIPKTKKAVRLRMVTWFREVARLAVIATETRHLNGEHIRRFSSTAATFNGDMHDCFQLQRTVCFLGQEYTEFHDALEVAWKLVQYRVDLDVTELETPLRLYMALARSVEGKNEEDALAALWSRLVAVT